MTALVFGFTKLVVDDLEALERFYCDVFGMKIVRRWTTDDHAYALDEVVLSLTGDRNGHLLIITRYHQRPCPPAGAAWTGFVVPDIHVAIADVERAGGRIEVPLHGNDEPRVLAAIAADPEGHLIEILQMMAT